ncbi:MAG: 4'-phosphopantetheinyl transferase superfamily protein [Steroidobacteraceae bacterium]|nr:4'-phosphopantetheinyl transferase superfamily protein [Steroidobacteraceae bacterium]MDW8260570.1 4'-phosphopantetheinyl transferase superfamily protein [Gammaproteobacteria bacterium]
MQRLILTYAQPPTEQEQTRLGRRLALALLGELDGRQYTEDDLRFTSYGRPYIEGASSFSIAHCKGMVVAAAATSGVIGVDIEPCDRDVTRALRRVCDAEEERLIARRGAVAVWVAKEAAIKCLGLSALMAGQVRLLDDRALLRQQVLFVQQVAAIPGYAVALASTVPLPPAQLWPGAS